MTLTWLSVLIVYGLATGFGSIQPLMWLLLLPFIIQDYYDGYIKTKRRL